MSDTDDLIQLVTESGARRAHPDSRYDIDSHARGSRTRTR